MKRPTRTDVARRLGVSVATVSYAFSNSTKIREETRFAVLEAARELGYLPSQVARSLITRRSMQLSIIVNDISNPVYPAMIAGFESAAADQGYIVNVCNGREHADEYFDSILSRSIDGILVEVLPHRFHRERLISLLDSGTKAVLFGSHGIETSKVAWFEIDYLRGMRLAVDHLVDLGHRHIAYLSGLSASDSYDRRIEGFLCAVAARGLSRECRVFAPDLALGTTIEDGEAMARSLLSSGEPYTAAICTNDLMAIGAIRAFAEEGLGIPRDLSVIGIDDAYLAAVVTPALTTIASDYYELGEVAFGLLDAAMKENRFGYVLHKPRLVVRASTGPAKS
jgi:DNA-binding LacI/PurR family transcriptional regulator